MDSLVALFVHSPFLSPADRSKFDACTAKESGGTVRLALACDDNWVVNARGDCSGLTQNLILQCDCGSKGVKQENNIGWHCS